MVALVPAWRPPRLLLFVMLIGAALLAISPGALAEHPPGVPQDLVAKPGPGTAAITLSWDRVPDATHYHVWLQDLPEPIAIVAQPDAAVPRVSYEDHFQPQGGFMPPGAPVAFGETRFYNVSAGNDAGESGRSIGASATTFSTCTPPLDVCVALHPVERLHEVYGPDAMSGEPLVTIGLRLGTLRIETDATYAEQALIVPEQGGQPDLSILNQDLGIVRIRYHEEPLGIAVGIGPPDPAATTAIATVWSARVLVYAAGVQIADHPGVAIFPLGMGEPGPKEGPGQDAPGAGLAAATIALALLAIFVSQRRSGRA